MKIRLVTKPELTEVFNAETGEPLKHVLSVDVHIGMDGAYTTLRLAGVPEIEGELEATIEHEEEVEDMGRSIMAIYLDLDDQFCQQAGTLYDVERDTNGSPVRFGGLNHLGTHFYAWWSDGTGSEFVRAHVIERLNDQQIDAVIKMFADRYNRDYLDWLDRLEERVKVWRRKLRTWFHAQPLRSSEAQLPSTPD